MARILNGAINVRNRFTHSNHFNMFGNHFANRSMLNQFYMTNAIFLYIYIASLRMVAHLSGFSANTSNAGTPLGNGSGIYREYMDAYPPKTTTPWSINELRAVKNVFSGRDLV